MPQNYCLRYKLSFEVGVPKQFYNLGPLINNVQIKNSGTLDTIMIADSVPRERLHTYLYVRANRTNIMVDTIHPDRSTHIFTLTRSFNVHISFSDCFY